MSSCFLELLEQGYEGLGESLEEKMLMLEYELKLE
jgi:hypothetical protein